MKYLFSTLILFTVLLSATAAELPGYLLDMKNQYANGMKVWAVEDDDMEDDNDNEFFVLKFESRQDDRVTDLDYLMRVTVQLTDKKTQSIVVAQTDRKPGPVPQGDFYADHTAWEFRIPFGQMKKPKMTACAIEFGFMQDGYFVPVAVEYDKVGSAEEIMGGEGTEVKMDFIRCSHYRWSEI